MPPPGWPGFAGGALADDPGRRRRVAVGGYTTTAVLSAAIGAARRPGRPGILRAGAWAARGLRVPARNALLADIVPPAVYGRAYGFERAMDNLGAIGGPLLAIGLVAVVGVRAAIGLSVIPGLLAALAIVYAIRHTAAARQRVSQPIRIRVRPVLRGQLGRLMIGITAFEVGNAAATLLILRATDLFDSGRSQTAATQLALVLYVLYNVAATVISIPAGRHGDRFNPIRVLVAGAVCFAAGYGVFAAGPRQPWLLAIGFILAGLGIGCGETAESAAVATLAPVSLRGSAFGLLATVASRRQLCRQRDRRTPMDRRVPRRRVPLPRRRHDHLCPAHPGQQETSCPRAIQLAWGWFRPRCGWSRSPLASACSPVPSR